MRRRRFLTSVGGTLTSPVFNASASVEGQLPAASDTKISASGRDTVWETVADPGVGSHPYQFYRAVGQ